MELLLLPKPQKIVYNRGEYLLKHGMYLQTLHQGELRSRFCAGLLQTEIERATGYMPEMTESNASGRTGIRYQKDDFLADGQYKIVISAEGVVLTAGSKAGALYATQTLRQIIRQCGAVLPAVMIEDEPCIPVRGFYHDVTRGRVPTLDRLKKLADLCAFYKINQLQLYVEHSYLFERLGGLFSDRDPLTESDIREFDAYCDNLGIELVPSLSGFGHLYELLRTKQYTHLCELAVDEKEPFSLYDRMAHHTLDVSNPESESLVKDLITEYAALFRSDKFNVCADETFDLGKGKNKERAEREGSTTGLYMEFLVKLCNIVKACGKTPMFWGDILQEFPEKNDLLPEGTVCLYWNYEPDAVDDKLKGLTDAGIRHLYVCPGVHGWNHLMNRYDHAYDNISAICRFAEKYQAQGVLVTDWGDYGHVNDPDFSTPGLIYGAAFSWQGSIMPKEEIDRMISVIEYGDRSGKLMEHISRLAVGEDVTWGQLVCYKENRVWDQFVPEPDDVRNSKLTLAIGEGYRMLLQLPESQRERFSAYLLAAEGQVLLNRVWKLINGNEASEQKDSRLAESLRLWYREYQKLWRRSSRESELARIGEVVQWYADLLS